MTLIVEAYRPQSTRVSSWIIVLSCIKKGGHNLAPTMTSPTMMCDLYKDCDVGGSKWNFLQN